MSVEALLSTQVIDTTSIGRSVMTAANAAAIRSAIDAQTTLVSATNIKTINSTSLLGSGDIAVSASPGGSSGQMQYNNAGAFGGTTAIVYAASAAHMTVTAQAATDVPVIIKGAVSQTANLQEWKDSAGAVIGAIKANGNISVGTASWPLIIQAENNQYNDYITSIKMRLILQASNIELNAPTVWFGALDYQNYTVYANSSGGVFQFNTDQAMSTMRWRIGDNTYDNKVGGTVEVIAGAALSTATTYKTGGIALISGGDAGGTDGSGGQVKIRSGRGRGAGLNSVVIQTSAVAASGTTLQTYRDAMQIDENATSGETPMLLLDITKGSLQRVSIGATDSGGTGYKLLRVPN